MARGATKQNQARAAKTSAPRRKPSRGARRQSRNTYEEALFFPKLRNHAKWVFVFLAFAFAIGFVVFGVGTGTGGSALGNLFSGSNNPTGGPSTSDLQKKVAAHPNDAVAWNQLASNYLVAGNTDQAINAYVRYTALKPKSVGGLNALAGLYQTKATRLAGQLQSAQAQASAVTPSPYLQPTALSPGTKKQPGQAIFGTPVIDSTLSTAYNTRAQNLQSEQRTALTGAETIYHKIAALQPRNAAVQLSLASVAQQASDVSTMIAALQRYLVLAPHSPQAPLVRKQLKLYQASSQLTPAQPKHK
jgi:tetratricopeptide (TPR) repeat protein